MKLYYSPGACSMSCHIGLEEAGLPYTGVSVDFDKPDTNSQEMERLNPMHAVPVLVTDQGKTLTQNAAILEYIADLKPASKLLPPAGTYERAVAMSWVSFVSSDLHKSFLPLFATQSITTHEMGRTDIRKWATDNLTKHLEHVDASLKGKDYLTGGTFTAADAYLFTVLGWCKWVNVPTDSYKNITAFMSRVYQRPAVQKVMKQEDLLN